MKFDELKILDAWVAEIRESKRGTFRKLINGFKNFPCDDCGVQYDPEIMDFDHVRGEKKFNISTATRYNSRVTADEVLTEIAKCDLVCANCHRTRTKLRRQQ